MSSIARLSLLAVALPLAASFAVAPVASSTARLAPLQPRALASPSATRGLAPTYSAARLPQLMMQEAAAVPPAGFMTHFKKFSNVFSNLFPLWTASVAGIGLMAPGVFTGISTEYFTGLLGLLMLSMGITLTVDDFKRVLQRPAIMVLGFAACYVLMPALALGLSNLIGLPAALTAGMVLVGSINGGQASNLCTYIARGDVALSVLMTTCTTIGAIFMTPLICKLLLGAIVPVDVAISTVQVVLVPIVVGMLANAKFPKTVKKIEPFSPVVGVLSTCVLVGSAVAQCAEPIKAAGLSLQLTAALLHILGGVVAYFGCKPLGYDEQTCRTFAIETSMKSSAFGFLLAKLHFSQFLVRVPAAVSVVWMALTGSILAVIFRAIPVKEESH